MSGAIHIVATDQYGRGGPVAPNALTPPFKMGRQPLVQQSQEKCRKISWLLLPAFYGWDTLRMDA